MQTPRTLAQWKARLDSAVPNWRGVLVESREKFPAIWEGVTGDSRRTSYTMRDRGDQVMMRETDEILDRYNKGEIGPSIAAALLLPYVQERVRHLGVLLPDGTKVRNGLIELPEDGGKMMLVAPDMMQDLSFLFGDDEVQDCTED